MCICNSNVSSTTVENITLSEADYKPDVPVKGTSLSTEPQAIHPPEMERFACVF